MSLIAMLPLDVLEDLPLKSVEDAKLFDPLEERRLATSNTEAAGLVVVGSRLALDPLLPLDIPESFSLIWPFV